MNRMQQISAILWLEQLAAEATRQAATIRSEIQDDAVKEYRDTGAAPTWRWQDLARVTLPVSQSGVQVSDPKAFLAWVEKHYPGEIVVETIRTIRTSWMKVFLDRVWKQSDGEVLADPEGGAKVDGLAVKAGGVPKSIAITADATAKHVFGQLAEHGLKELAAAKGPFVPVVLAELEASHVDA
jgi:hypothetical protein